MDVADHLSLGHHSSHKVTKDEGRNLSVFKIKKRQFINERGDESNLDNFRDEGDKILVTQYFLFQIPKDANLQMTQVISCPFLCFFRISRDVLIQRIEQDVERIQSHFGRLAEQIHCKRHVDV